MTTPAEQHARNLRFRDNPLVFDESARWLVQHRDEGVPAMLALLSERGPAAIGICLVLAKLDDPATIPALESTLEASDERLAYEAARALAAIYDAEAAAALRRGAGRRERGVLIASIRGIELRADPKLCDAVKPHLEGDEEVRWYAERAWKAAACE